MKILHIISYPRSGSTILGLAFGQYQEASYLGEVSALFTHIWTRPCGCSMNSPIKVSDCPVWGPILTKSQVVLEKYNFWDSEFPGVLKDRRPDFLKDALKQLKSKKPGPELKATLEIMDIVFHEAANVENAKIIVDSSKNLDYFRILQHHFQKDVVPLHLFRDSRGVVFSGRKNPSVPGKATPLSFWRSSRIALGWGAKNMLIEKYIAQGSGNSLTLLYEDWCSKPKAITDEIMNEILEASPKRSPFVDKGTFNVEPCHSFFGNRSRKSSGTIEIKSDRSWRKGMDTKYRVASSFASAIFLKKYGYNILN